MTEYLNTYYTHRITFTLRYLKFKLFSSKWDMDRRNEKKRHVQFTRNEKGVSYGIWIFLYCSNKLSTVYRIIVFFCYREDV